MSVNSFIAEIAPLIQKEAKDRGYKVCSTVIAQAIIESRYGESGLAKYHNYFGLKCGSSWKGASVNMKTKEEYKVGTLTTIKDNFRAYPNMAEGVKGYYDFVSTKRYANLKTAKNCVEYAQMLKADGYATSSTYVQTLCNTINKYNLAVYDGMDLPDLKKGDRGTAVICLQNLLNSKNYLCAVDGIFGLVTETRLIEAQGYYGLVKTGICDRQTWRALYG